VTAVTGVTGKDGCDSKSQKQAPPSRFSRHCRHTRPLTAFRQTLPQLAVPSAGAAIRKMCVLLAPIAEEKQR
jgi:hypothetical protein